MIKFLLSVSILIWAGSATAQNSKEPHGFAVVELFTSQGCGKSPAAENVIKQITDKADAEGKQVISLAYHVDYWNKYGWNDPYSAMRYTRRQSNYVSATSSDEVFTPQVFVNGAGGFVGSDKTKLNAEINKALKSSPKQTIALTHVSAVVNDTMTVGYAASKADRNSSLVIVISENKTSTRITKGENIGKTLEQENVVRLLQIFPINIAKGEIKFPVKKLKPGNGFRMVAYIQNKQTKKITAAAQHFFK